MQRDTIPGRVTFWTTFRLGWRNLRRNRRRTWITATTVAVAVLLLQTVTSMMIGLEQQSYDNLINYQTAHAKLYAEGYFDRRDELPLDQTLEQPESLQDLLRAVEGVAATTPRLVFSAQLSNGVDQIPCLGTGIVVTGSDTDVFRIPQAVVAGSYFETNDAEGILLGSGLAELFGVAPGDWLTVLAKTRAGAYEAVDLEIIGLVGTGNPLIDQNSFLIPMRSARAMLGMSAEATELAVRFGSLARESATLTRLREAVESVEGLEVKGWREAEEDFLAFAQVKRTGQTVFISIFVILAVVGIANTILMAAYERTREIGMLMAMGLRGNGIRGLFLAEGALTGLLGGAIGSLLALAIVAYFASTGIDLQAIYGDIDLGYPVRERFYPALDIGRMAVSWLLTGVLAALASLYPAARASRQDPVKALRYV